MYVLVCMSMCICTVIYTWFYVGALTICMCVKTRGLDNNYVLRRVLAIVKSVIGKSVVGMAVLPSIQAGLGHQLR